MKYPSTVPRSLLAVCAVCLIIPAIAHRSDVDWYEAEIGYLADLKSRVTGSPNHNKLIDHIQCELQLLGLEAYTDTLDFVYLDQPLSPPQLTVGGEDVKISSYAPYSGSTDALGVGGKLVDLTTFASPNEHWALATDNIAVVNITNHALNLGSVLSPWPGQPAWDVQTGNPIVTANSGVANLTLAGQAEVKGVVYVWDNITMGNLQGQYVPFTRLYQGCPTLHVTGEAAQTVRTGAKSKLMANLTLSGNLIPNTPTRSIWVVFNGTTKANESVIINTHTDGVNAVEENGHIALLAQAKELVACPPQRTTILAFITGHMHQPAFISTGVATKRWMDDNPIYWRGDKGGYKAVASVTVEHLGAVNFTENLATNSYHSAGTVNDELLFTNTPEMLSLTEKNWNTTSSGVVRINNPITKGVQLGEGEPLTEYGVPNMALVTSPLYLVAEWPMDFDERQLVDIDALKRQVDSLKRLWSDLDTLPAEAFGIVPPYK